MRPTWANLNIAGVTPANQFFGESQARPQGQWDISLLVGQLSEVVASNGISVVSWMFDLIAQAQKNGEPAAWICDGTTLFFPADAVMWGISLEDLIVVKVATSDLAKATDIVLRGGGFGLAIVERGEKAWTIAQESRLLALASHHQSTVVFLSHEKMVRPSSLVSLRLQAFCERIDAGKFVTRLVAIKDKKRTPYWECEKILRGPLGLR